MKVDIDIVKQLKISKQFKSYENGVDMSYRDETGREVNKGGRETWTGDKTGGRKSN
jgi:hypothetical protein